MIFIQYILQLEHTIQSAAQTLCSLTTQYIDFITVAATFYKLPGSCIQPSLSVQFTRDQVKYSGSEIK